jgi:calcineurin-like phosphoesterase family protein
MIYFTSDTHFGSQRTLELSKRPFANVGEMDFALMTNWNKTVSQEDTIYHLGDFGNYEIAQYLNGTIILIPGNYEYDGIKENEITVKELNQIFDDVTKTNYLKIAKENFVDCIDTKYKDIVPDYFYLTHEPNDCIKNDTNIFNLFGHIHKLQMVRKYGLNVGTDCHNFRPISINDVMFYRNAILNYYDENVFE